MCIIHVAALYIRNQKLPADAYTATYLPKRIFDLALYRNVGEIEWHIVVSLYNVDY